MPQFTPTQGRYLSFIHAYTAGFGEPPAESEIAEALRVSPPSVNQMIKTLEKKGLIRRQPGVARTLEVLVPASDLPRWNKTIVRTTYEWGPAKPRKAKGRSSLLTADDPQDSADSAGDVLAEDDSIYQLKITLLGTEPPIWRRIETPDVPLEELHELIQTAMGWTNSHLHQFEIDGGRYVNDWLMQDGFDDPDSMAYSDVWLSDFINPQQPKLQILYEYDFGDGWEHLVELERVKPADPGMRYPRCTEGARACPPEDVGGIYGYADCVAALADPRHEQHEHYREWIGEYDPEAFSPTQATRAMRQGLPGW